MVWLIMSLQKYTRTIFKVAVSCWNEEAIREAYKYVKETHNMLIRLQVEHQIFGTPTEKLSLKVRTNHASDFIVEGLH